VTSESEIKEVRDDIRNVKSHMYLEAKIN